MKVEIDFGKLKRKLFVSKWVWIFIAGLFIGAIIGISIKGIEPTSADWLSFHSGTPQCLTVADLNRSDIVTSIVLSRFCEGMGLQSSVYWQRDINGNVYGLPVCLEKK